MTEKQFAHDMLYKHKHTEIRDFVFDKNVARVFSDMIERSVPGYRMIVDMIGLFAEQYARPGTQCYDLGCSLGAVTLSMYRYIQNRKCRIVAVDNSAAMTDACKVNVKRAKIKKGVDIYTSDIRSVEITNASVVVLNFILQFIPPDERETLLARVYKGMCADSILILSEKISFDGKQDGFQEIFHHLFKKNHGYSDLEISQKRTALEKVLMPEMIEEHKKRLYAVGFCDVYVWFQCFNFISLVALK